MGVIERFLTFREEITNRRDEVLLNVLELIDFSFSWCAPLGRFMYSDLGELVE